LFDVQDRQIVERHTLRLSGPINAIAFSRTDGKLAGVGADGVVHIWSISDYRIEHTLQTGEEVSAVSFDSTSGFLVVGSQSGSVSVWSLDTGQPIARFTHGTAVRGVAFSVAGPPLLFYGGAGGFGFQPWRLSDLVDHACRQLSRSELSDTEWTRFVGSGTKVSSCPKSRSESAP
jgi:WD40 repeat protein